MKDQRFTLENRWATVPLEVSEVCIFILNKGIYFKLIWIEANVTVHPTVSMSCSFRAFRVKGHSPDFQIRHCRRSLTFRVESKICFCCILSSVFSLALFLLLRRKTKGRMYCRMEGSLAGRWWKGQVRLKYHSLPGARHRLWCSRGVCDKSGVQDRLTLCKSSSLTLP